MWKIIHNSRSQFQCDPDVHHKGGQYTQQNTIDSLWNADWFQKTAGFCEPRKKKHRLGWWMVNPWLHHCPLTIKHVHPWSLGMKSLETLSHPVSVKNKGDDIRKRNAWSNWTSSAVQVYPGLSIERAKKSCPCRKGQKHGTKDENKKPATGICSNGCQDHGAGDAGPAKRISETLLSSSQKTLNYS